MSRLDLPGYGIATTPDYPPIEVCVNNQCRADGVEIDEFGYCPTCRPREGEGCAEWLDRMADSRFSS